MIKKQLQDFQSYLNCLLVLLLLILTNNISIAKEDEYIVFVSREDGNIYSLINGTVKRQTFNPFRVLSPSLSPDGKYIAYNSILPRSEIFRRKTNGDEETQLTFDSHSDEPDWSPDGKKIVFNRLGDIYVMDVDGKSVVQLTNHPESNWSPDWSPDGREIIFLSTREGLIKLYIMNADGTSQRPLLVHGSWIADSKWSPTGRYIAYKGKFEIPPKIGTRQIYVINTVNQKLTLITDDDLEHYTPAWSPNAEEIVFAAGRDQERDIYVIRLADRRITQLTRTPESEFQPTWSPDGRHIAFVFEKDARVDIYHMTRNGDNLTNLTDHPDIDFAPAWSPDVQHIAFVRLVRGIENHSTDIYLMEADGRNQVNLTRDGNSTLPTWSPGGRQLAFVHVSNNQYFIHIMDKNGQNRHQIHVVPDRISSLNWSADGKRLVYNCQRDWGSQICIFYLDRQVEDALHPEVAGPRDMQWSPVGRRIAFSAGVLNPVMDREGIFIINRDGKNKRLVFSKPDLNGSEGGVSWSPDEQSILFGGEKGSLFLVDVNTGHRNLFRKSAHSPDWIVPKDSHAVSPYGKHWTSWASLKQKILNQREH